MSPSHQIIWYRFGLGSSFSFCKSAVFTFGTRRLPVILESTSTLRNLEKIIRGPDRRHIVSAKPTKLAPLYAVHALLRAVLITSECNSFEGIRGTDDFVVEDSRSPETKTRALSVADSQEFIGEKFWSKLQCVDFHDPQAPETFAKSLKETGFAVLVTHPLTPGLVDDVYAEWREFLTQCADPDRPDLRENYLYDSETQAGYFPMDISETAKGSTQKDLKQFFQLYFPNGSYPDEVSDKARQLFHEMHSLGRTLLQWIDDGMDEKVKAGLPCDLADALSYENTMLRILHYPSYREEEKPKGAVRAAAHEDINLITVLPSGSSRGLQVWSKEDECWYEVPCHTQSIVVNIGDMLQEMTGGDYVATTHRVVKLDDEVGGTDRMSCPCFLHPHADVYLSDKYPTSRKFLLERLSELGVI
ncbi:hypothetical protein CYMTET_37866 [Cymbomonas tetramitiformis]|uniref:Fe2OG dioxygenase domain-containing protein n=1 Tax=Cymbomonas tetramitiformis TaxID=36881 RepID=A0AAE0CEL7_9CHLO|nr:hypothetical protein CYMTET_46470 [Cymbomonas tetramitiformis]KAK3252859.1 hypothetical protein CYMTET_37866 [Cymbomonas tetramitiformis]